MQQKSARSEELARAREEKEELDALLKVRALLATAESSEFEGETDAFRAKAMTLADRYDIDPALLEFPCEDLKVAVVMAELNRLREVVQAYEDEEETWETKTAEWSALLDEYDGVLEVACDILCLPLKRLPYGCRRHFRPQDRAKIEKLIWDRVTSGSHAESGLPATEPLAAEPLAAEPLATEPLATENEAEPAALPESR